MAGSKKFINNSKQDLNVTLFVRKGANPGDGDAGQVSFKLPAGASHQQSYGDSSNIYLNAISFSWDDNGAALTKDQRVVTRGCWWDDVMNTNSIITWSAVGRASITGSN